MPAARSRPASRRKGTKGQHVQLLPDAPVNTEDSDVSNVDLTDDSSDSVLSNEEQNANVEPRGMRRTSSRTPVRSRQSSPPK